MNDMASDRRRSRRMRIGTHGVLSARVRPGMVVAVLDISAEGASVELSRRLLPGSSVDFQIETADGRTNLRGRVLRCIVSRLDPNSVSYRAAIAFQHHRASLVDKLPNDRDEYAVPARPRGGACPDRVDLTPDML